MITRAGVKAVASCRGNILTEYLVVLMALAAIWFTSDVLLNATNTYYGGFSAVISGPVLDSDNSD